MADPKLTQKQVLDDPEEQQANSVIDSFVADYEDSNPYIKMKETNPVEGIYLGVDMEEDTFNPGKKLLAYKIGIEGKEKILKSGSLKLAQLFKEKNPKPSDFIRITLSEDGFSYTLEISPDGIPF